MREFFIIIIIVTLLFGCAPHYKSSGYTPQDVGKPITIQKGEVENIRSAEIEQGETGFGSVAGAYAGGVAGSAVGEGKGKALATIFGVIIGAIAGSNIEKNANKRSGEEITVRLDDGRVFAVVQEVSDERLQVGDRVEVLKTADGRMRVRKASKDAPPPPNVKVREPGTPPPTREENKTGD